ncbi:hypothetical protein KI387_040365, partial [Taxus chinensis]
VIAQSPLEPVSKDVAAHPEEQALAPQSREENQFLSMTSEEKGLHYLSALDQDDHPTSPTSPKELEQHSHLVPSEYAQIEAGFEEVSEVTLPSEVVEHQEIQHAEVDHSEKFTDGNLLFKGPELVEGYVPIQAEEQEEVKDLQENVSQIEIAFQQPGDDGNLVSRKSDAAVPFEPEPSNLSSFSNNSKDESAATATDSNEIHTVDEFHAKNKAVFSSSEISDSTILAMVGHSEELEKDADIGQNRSESLVKPDPTMPVIAESDPDVEKLKKEMKMMEAALQGCCKTSP